MARIVQLLKAKEPVELTDQVLAPVNDGEVLVRIEACALGQLDWNLLTLDAPPRLPLTPGHEAVGVIQAVGRHTRLRPGERVFVTPLSSCCQVCAWCRSGEWRRCADAKWRGMHGDGALGTHVVTHENGLVPLEIPVGMPDLPEPLPLPLAASLALVGGSLWTAVGAVRSLHLVQSSRVAVFGVGGVGHLVVQVARALGHKVFADDADPERVNLAQELGAAPLEGNVDAAVVCTPSTQALQRAVRMLVPGGRLALTGSSPTGRIDLSVAELVWRGLTITGGLLGARGDLDEGLSLLLSGRVKATVELISLDDVPARLWALRDLGFPGRLVALPR
ncbi:MAG: alcohol dehydrogenase catalytic domain-containing protein [Archangium sp.]|nr:alcohol dehydrogenase catalytic domain-containing protein [Archangium sp.]